LPERHLEGVIGVPQRELASVKAGDKGTVYWTNIGLKLKAKGTVVKANPESTLVKIEQDVEMEGYHWVAGQVIKVPAAHRETVGNRFEKE
jgi:hypothetical protein